MEQKTKKTTAPKKTAEHHEEKAVKASAEKAEKKARAPKTAKTKKTSEKHEDHVHLPSRRCQIESCKREYRAKGYCGVHYRMWRHGKFGHARFKTCKDYGCTKPMAMNRHGFCEEHFQNYYVKGMEQAHAPVAEKPAAKAEEKAAS